MKNLILILSTLMVVGCASNGVKKSNFTWTDRAARLMIDPNGIPAEHYAMIQDSLIKSDRFVVIDRPQDLDTIQKVTNSMDPEVVKSRWMEYSKRYDVGGIVTAHVQCFNKGSQKFCHQFMAINNTETGELVAQAEGENSAMTAVSYDYIVPDWDATANLLVEKFDANKSKMDARRMVDKVREIANEAKPVIQKVEQELKPSPKAEPVQQAAPAPAAKVEAPVTPPAIETPKAPAVTEAPKTEPKVEEPKAQPAQAKDAPKAPKEAEKTPEVKPTEEPTKLAAKEGN